MGDRIQFNTRERTSSDDANDLQSLWAKDLADFLGELGAQRVYGSAFGGVIRSWSRGLALVPNGANATLDLGVLLQYSPTHPAAPSAVESEFRLGFNRAQLPIVMPAPGADTYYLLEAQVADVVATNVVRDVFDIPTQKFLPTNVDKRIERRIQVQLVAGSAADLPAPSGDPWVPLFGILVPAGGFVTFDNEAVVDLRNEWADGQDSEPTPAAIGDGVAWVQHMATANSPQDPNLGVLLGNCDVRGQAGGFRLALQSDPLFTYLAPLEEVGFALVADELVHLYLCPVAAGSFVVAPKTATDLFTDPAVYQQGVLVVSNDGPSPYSRTKVTPITLPAPWGNFNGGVVGGGFCLHVASFMVDPTGTFLLPMEVSGGGNHQLAWIGSQQGVGSIASGLELIDTVLVHPGGGLALPQAIDLNGVIPADATQVELEVFVSGGVAQTYEVIFRDAITLDPYGSVTGADLKKQRIKIPVRFANGGFVGGLLEAVTYATAPANVTFAVSVVGWEI